VSNLPTRSEEAVSRKGVASQVVEIVGVAHDGQDAAISAGLAKAGQSIRNIRWFEVIAQLGTSKMTTDFCYR
jgi:flavin-binding protein dodecin